VRTTISTRASGESENWTENSLDSPLQRFGQHRLHARAHVGVVVLARHVDQAGRKAAVDVAVQEQPRALALAQPQDAGGDAVQVVDTDLEQLVARKLLEDGDQGLGRVAARQETGARRHGGDLAPQQRDVDRLGAVGHRGEQAQEAAFADDLATLVEALDADVVEMAGPVHRGARVGLGQHQHMRLAGLCAHLGRQGRKRGRSRLGAGAGAQDAQAGAGQHAQHVLPLLVGQFVVALAEQGEVVLGQPAQEGQHLGQLVGWHRRRLLFEHRDGVDQLRAHRLPVVDRGAHVAQDAGQAVVQRLQAGGLGAAVDLDVDQRFEPPFARVAGWQQGFGVVGGVAPDLHHRVHDQVQRQALAVDLHRDRIDEEGHVVVDDLDHGVRGLPAMFVDARVDHPQPGLAAGELARKVPVRQGRAIQVVGRSFGQILGIDVGVIPPYKGLQCRLLGRGQAVLDAGDDLVDAFGVGRRRHGCLQGSLLSWPVVGAAVRCDAALAGGLIEGRVAPSRAHPRPERGLSTPGGTASDRMRSIMSGRPAGARPRTLAEDLACKTRTRQHPAGSSGSTAAAPSPTSSAVRPTAALRTLKLLSENPEQYPDAAVEGIRRLLGLKPGEPITPEHVECVKMGTTVATNALLERQGEPTLLVTTRGFRDALRIAYQARPRLFDRHIVLPELLYERVIEAAERVGAQGEVIVPLDEMHLRERLWAAFDAGLRACAIVFMHGWRFTAHEAAAARMARELGFTQVSVSRTRSAR
jgi:hypothetical protein